MKTIKDALIILYSEILESYYTENEFKRLRCYKTFYEFIENQLDKFKLLCNEIDEEDIDRMFVDLENFFIGKKSKQRFIHLLDKIVKNCLVILQLAYKGDHFCAYKHFALLMGSKDNKFSKYHLGDYLVEGLQDYIEKGIEDGVTLYRMRDVKKEDKAPENCWHVPFCIRKYASFQRYNMYGIPCLYLADSLETSNAELGPLDGNNNRWYAEFTPSHQNKFGDIAFYDFTIPTKKRINEEDSYYRLFEWLITYPLRLLCSVKVYDKGNFCEEYIFPQMIFHWVYFSGNGYLNGFKYSSTKNLGGVNYVFPATYETKQPPTYNDKQISERLEKLFTASEPKLYKEGRSRKKYSIEITEL